jgi:hypothetical protein
VRSADLKQLGPGTHCHECAPAPWRDVPDVTGDYDLDATILHRENADLPHRLALYLKQDRNAFQPVTAYNGYHGYGGDN